MGSPEYETAANEDSSGDDSSDDEDEVGPAGEPAAIDGDAPQIVSAQCHVRISVISNPDEKMKYLCDVLWTVY